MALTIIDTLTDRTQKSQISDATSDLTFVDVSGIKTIPVSVKESVPEQSANAVLTQVASSATSVSLLVANPSRKGVILFNDSTKLAYVAFAATASTAAYSLKLPGGSLYEKELPVYTGAISAIWSAVNGNMVITELT